MKEILSSWHNSNFFVLCLEKKWIKNHKFPLPCDINTYINVIYFEGLKYLLKKYFKVHKAYSCLNLWQDMKEPLAKIAKKYLQPGTTSIHNEALLSLHLLTLFGPSSSFELSNDLLWKWFRGKECWNWLFRSLFPLNGFLPSGVWKSRVLFQWPPSQPLNWSSFLSSLLPLKVHRIIKSRFGSTYFFPSITQCPEAHGQLNFDHQKAAHYFRGQTLMGRVFSVSSYHSKCIVS